MIPIVSHLDCHQQKRHQTLFEVFLYIPVNSKNCVQLVTERSKNMNHSVLNWNLNDASIPASRRITTNSSDVPFTVDSKMEELTWENGQLLVNGLVSGLTRASSQNNLNSPIPSKETWDNSRAAVGTLESIVNLATQKKPPPPPPPPLGNVDYDDINVPWLDHRTLQKPSSPGGSPTAVATSVTDALVPCGTPKQQGVAIPEKQGIGTCEVNGSARVKKGNQLGPNTVQVEGERSSCQRSMSGSKQVLTVDTCEKESSGFGAATASFWSQGISSEKPASTNNTTSLDDNDESKNKETTARSSLSTKRSRAAAIHNQSERKRRETINQKMKTLQKMVPNSSKTDKASMLDEVIEYVRQLQAQAQMMMMMNKMMGMGMMMPFAMPQHMPMMPPMNMNMNMGMDMSNIMACQNLTNMSPLINPSAAFMPMAAPSAWDLTTDQSPSSTPMGSSASAR
ncbi:hypothetical protein V2J09_015264 [Rumex salicifolius]